MYNSYLAIGTVVMLKGEGKKVMIIGYYGRDTQDKAVDYMGVTYPEGYLSADAIVGFNQNEVLQVLHEGYKDLEQERFYGELSAFAQGLTKQSTPTVPFVNTPTQPVQQVQQPNQETVQQPISQSNNDDIDTI